MDRQVIRESFERALLSNLGEEYRDLSVAVAKAVFEGLLPGLERAINQEVMHHEVQTPHLRSV